jgi:hypothetical protein
MPVQAATSLIGADIQADAAKDAASMQAQAAKDANQLQRDMYNQQRSDYEPWRKAGIGALGDMQGADYKRDFTMADFQQDPGYAFRMAEGQKALERSAAAKGGLQSGGTLKALSRYGQDYASGEYQNAYNRFNADRDRRFNRLSSLAGVGQTATSQLGQAGMNYANTAGGNMMAGGNNQAASRLAQGQAWAQGWTGVGNAYKDNQDFALKAASSFGSMMGGGV